MNIDFGNIEIDFPKNRGKLSNGLKMIFNIFNNLKSIDVLNLEGGTVFSILTKKYYYKFKKLDCGNFFLIETNDSQLEYFKNYKFIYEIEIYNEILIFHGKDIYNKRFNVFTIKDITKIKNHNIENISKNANESIDIGEDSNIIFFDKLSVGEYFYISQGNILFVFKKIDESIFELIYSNNGEKKYFGEIGKFQFYEKGIGFIMGDSKYYIINNPDKIGKFYDSKDIIELYDILQCSENFNELYKNLFNFVLNGEFNEKYFVFLINEIEQFRKGKNSINKIPKFFGLRNLVKKLYIIDNIKKNKNLHQLIGENNFFQMIQGNVGNCYFVSALFMLKSYINCIEIFIHIFKKNGEGQEIYFHGINDSLIVDSQDIQKLGEKKINGSIIDNILEYAYLKLRSNMARYNNPGLTKDGKTIFSICGGGMAHEGGDEIETLKCILGRKFIKNSRYFSIFSFEGNSLFENIYKNILDLFKNQENNDNIKFSLGSLNFDIYLLNHVPRNYFLEFFPHISGNSKNEKIKNLIYYAKTRKLDEQYYVIKDFFGIERKVFMNHSYIIGEISIGVGYVEIVNPHNTKNARFKIKIEDLQKYFIFMNIVEFKS